MSDLERLAELQDLDTAIDHIAYRREHLAERIHHRQCAATTAAARSSLAANLARRASLDTEYAALEQHGREVDTKISRLEAQMRNVVVTREAEAFQREIALLRGERDLDDERGLEILDEVERLSTDAAAVQVEIDRASAVEAEASVLLAGADTALDQELADLRERRAALASDLPGALVKDYEHRRPSFDGVAVARLHGSRCTGCHLDLSRAEVEAVRATPADAMPECPQCARILVR